MPKLGFTIDEPYDHKFNVDIKVSFDGMFTCNLDPDTAKLFNDNGVVLKWNQRAGRSCAFSSDTMKGIKTQIEEKIKELCSLEEVKRETVLQYMITTSCSYCITKDGHYAPNGSWPGVDYGKTEGWHEGTVSKFGMNKSPTGLQFFANPTTKVTMKFKASGKERIVYERISVHHIEIDVDNPIHFLASICGEQWPEGDLQEIPYTDEAGRFFVGLYKSLWAMNEKIKPFVDKDNIHKLIAGGAKLLQ